MKNLSLITLIGFVLFMANGITGPISSLYVQSLGANYVTIGVLGAVTSLAMILFNYIWGHASDYFAQRKTFLVGGLAVLAVSDGLIAVAPHYAYLFPLRVLAAVAQAAYSTTSLALMGDLLEQQAGTRGRRMGVYRGLGSLGFGLMAFISGSVADWLSIRVPFYLAAGLAAVAFVLALGLDEPAAARRPMGLYEGAAFARQLLHSWAASIKAGFASGTALLHGESGRRANPTAQAQVGSLPLLPLLVSALLWSLVTGAVYAVWANYMVNELEYSMPAMSRLWAIASLSEFPLMIVAGWLSDRVGRLEMLSMGFVAWTLVFWGYVTVPVMPWIIVVQLVRGFAYSAFTVTAMTYAAEVRKKEQRGQISGLYNSANGLGAILGSSFGGALTEFAGFVTMISVNATTIFAGAIYLGVEAVRYRGRAKKAHEAMLK